MEISYCGEYFFQHGFQHLSVVWFKHFVLVNHFHLMQNEVALATIILCILLNSDLEKWVTTFFCFRGKIVHYPNKTWSQTLRLPARILWFFILSNGCFPFCGFVCRNSHECKSVSYGGKMKTRNIVIMRWRRGRKVILWITKTSVLFLYHLSSFPQTSYLRIWWEKLSPFDSWLVGIQKNM